MLITLRGQTVKSKKKTLLFGEISNSASSFRTTKNYFPIILENPPTMAGYLMYGFHLQSNKKINERNLFARQFCPWNI